jgi:predicted ATPase
VLGREFSYALLQAVAGWSDAALDSALEKLAEADLLFVDGAAPQSSYRFKHALIQDAAYESLLKSRRHALHRRAAEALAAATDSQLEIVARHFTHAGDTESAIEWWGKAGDAALRRSAFQEAISNLGKAIEMADKASASESATMAGAQQLVATHRAKLQVSLGQALIWTKGHQAQETTAAFAKAVELADRT